MHSIVDVTSIKTVSGVPSRLSMVWERFPTDMQSTQSKQVVTKLANSLLDAKYDFEGEHKRWLTFGVPRHGTLLSALKALAAHGYAHDTAV